MFIASSTGTANNAGAILVLGRDLVVVPKLIHPLPPAISSPETSPERHIEDTWMQVLLPFRTNLSELWCEIFPFNLLYKGSQYLFVYWFQ